MAVAAVVVVVFAVAVFAVLVALAVLVVLDFLFKSEKKCLFYKRKLPLHNQCRGILLFLALAPVVSE
ncbi:hypothetical protein ABB05_00870 [Lederbergia galactosidilytica]|uniref:Uncharacterized protein n=1 Tax=Lederbergia galactosidilytica TaxID=217031 RepID=A0A178A9S1_9BACI|nr:hypothetical protein ABB05_00870 [Lederbergia galactosidilytica]